MATPLRHRQTKEAANGYVQPKATAPHLDSTISRNACSEQIASALPPKGDLSEAYQTRRYGPTEHILDMSPAQARLGPRKLV
jgi:hypothetical protein